MTILHAKIIGTGSAVPERVLTNHDLEQMVDTSDDWITVRTGIKERRVASEGEFTSTFATRAAQRALEMAGVDPAELDLGPVEFVVEFVVEEVLERTVRR